MNFESETIKQEKKQENNILEKIPHRMDDIEAEKVIKEKINVDEIKEKLKNFNDEKLILAIARLVLELKDKLTNYDIVLGDDAGGRLMTLFIGRIINKKKESLDLDKSEIKFIAGGHKSTKIIENFEEMNINADEFVSKRLKNNKILLTTEYIERGQGMIWLIDLLEKNKIDFDIATPCFNISTFIENYNVMSEEKNKLLKRIYYGADKDCGVMFHYHPGLGVIRSNLSKSAHAKIESRSLFKDKKDARESIKILADELYKLVE